MASEHAALIGYSAVVASVIAKPTSNKGWISSLNVVNHH